MVNAGGGGGRYRFAAPPPGSRERPRIAGRSPTKGEEEAQQFLAAQYQKTLQDPRAPQDHRIVDQEIRTLEEWALGNMQDARRDKIRFWVFKLPALVGAASTAALEAFGYGQVVIVVGAVSALCIGIDALRPGGLLYNTHHRAGNDLRALQQDIVGRWHEIILIHPDETDPERRKKVAALLKETRKKKRDISYYITAAEASLGKVDPAHRVEEPSQE